MLGNALAVLRARWYLRQASYVAPSVRLWGEPAVHNQGTMLIGERVRLDSRVARLELATGPGGRLEIGPQTYINYGCSISASRLVKIGARCIIGTHVLILDNDFHRLEPDRRLEMPPSAPVILEDNVWLGARVIVLPGVTIGADSVVGAGSVVTQDIHARCLAVGVPARVIRAL